jgi:hypothetical protein
MNGGTTMKLLGVVSTATLFLLIGTAVPAFAQEQHHDAAAKPEKQAQQAKPAQKEERAAPARQEEHAKPAQQAAQAKPVRQEEQAKPAARQEQARSQDQHQMAKPVRQENQAKPAVRQEQARTENPAPNNRTMSPSKTVSREATRNTSEQPRVQHTAADQQRQRSVPALRLSSRGSGRIPDERFRSNFGSGHRFRIGAPVMVGGYSRFQYGGFWFGFVQPWPVAWYYTDDVYVDFIDGGYYLCDPSYPGDRVLISVVI